MGLELLTEDHWRLVAKSAGAWALRPWKDWPHLSQSPLCDHLMGLGGTLGTIGTLISESFFDRLRRLQVRRDAHILEIASDANILAALFSRYLNAEGRYHLVHQDPCALTWFYSGPGCGDRRMSGSLAAAGWQGVPDRLKPDFVFDASTFLMRRKEKTASGSGKVSTLGMLRGFPGARICALLPLYESLPPGHGLDVQWMEETVGPFSAPMPCGRVGEGQGIDVTLFDRASVGAALADLGLHVEAIAPAPVGGLPWRTWHETWCAQALLVSTADQCDGFGC